MVDHLMFSLSSVELAAGIEKVLQKCQVAVHLMIILCSVELAASIERSVTEVSSGNSSYAHLMFC